MTSCLRKKEKGTALLLTLICLALGSILIASSIAYADSMLLATSVRDERNEAFYAADSGVDDAIWCIKNSVVPPRATLPQNINGYQVTINTFNQGFYSIYAGEFVPISGHVDWMHITEEVIWVPGENAYRYTVTVTRDPSCSGNIKIQEVGARLPPGYSYTENSADDPDFPLNLSDDEPSVTLDGQNAEMLKWVFGSPRPTLTDVDPTVSQAFYFTGTGEFSGYYSWIIAEREDIGTISMIQGDVYIITAQAISPLDGSVKSTVICDAMLTLSGDIYIIRWRISP